MRTYSFILASAVDGRGWGETPIYYPPGVGCFGGSAECDVGMA
jgi:hypothetical protein